MDKVRNHHETFSHLYSNSYSQSVLLAIINRGGSNSYYQSVLLQSIIVVQMPRHHPIPPPIVEGGRGEWGASSKLVCNRLDPK